MGHFPMSEDPEGFLRHLRPVLERILSDTRPGGCPKSERPE
jgi:hypothetical protein